jgi:tetratricopeptide (TPR) repeat protein
MDPIVTAGGIGTEGAPLRVLLSHTSDLGKPDEKGSFVGAAVAAIQRARHAVTDMAYLAARATSPAAYCVDMVARSDIYVGIIGVRYGSPVRGRPDVSYTKLEFEAAGEHGQPRLIFLIREDSVHMPPADEPPERRARQDAFRARLQDAGLTAAWVDSPAELELALYQALVELTPPLLARALALLATLPTDVLVERGPLPAGPRMPIRPNPLFVGRGAELLQIATALKGGDSTVALGQVVASTGLGGLGKTQLAVEFVHRYGRFFAGGVFWLSFASTDEIPLQVANCAGSGAVGLEADVSSRPLEERVKLVQSAWQSALPRLLVFDNCEEESLLERWRPTSGGCRVLVTSRRSHRSPTLGVTALPVDLLPRPDSIDLLRQYRPDLAADDPRLDAIAGKLGDLPLALHLAGRYLLACRSEVSLEEYLAELEQPELIRHASLLGEGLEDSPSPTHHVQSLAQTFALCLGRLDREGEVDRVAIALLARMARMAPGEPVPRDLLARTLEEVSARRRAAGLRRLGAVGLVEEGEGCLRLHRLLVHFVRQEGLDPDAQPAVDRVLIRSGRDAYQGHLTGSALAAAIPHLVDVAGAAVQGPGDERRAAALCTAAGRALENAGDFKAARPLYERALAIQERSQGPDHPDTARSLDNLAELLWYQGEVAAAQYLFQRALAIQERVLGPDHPSAARSLHGLGVALWTQGELVTARVLLQRALTIREQILGPDHPHTAIILHSLGVLLHAQGELAAARPLYERTLDIRERVLGPDHPDTIISAHSLGVVLRDKGELHAARSLLERVLDIRERVLGPDHPDTAVTLHALARLLHTQGELAAARSLFERALDISERALGPNHPNSASSLNDLALLLKDQGELDGARSLFERALNIRERVLGPDHLYTAISLNDLARFLGDQGERDAARRLYQRALAIWEHTPGPDHPQAAYLLNGLARRLQTQGQLDTPRNRSTRAMSIRERVPDHPDTARSLHDLSMLLRDQGELDAARHLLERALAIRERVLGPNHPDTVGHA